MPFHASSQQASGDSISQQWIKLFKERLALQGHRNWILVVDKAFPLQSARGMTIINSSQELPIALNLVMTEISYSTHVKPILYTDTEFRYITEDLAPGTDKLKKNLELVLKKYPLNSMLHEAVFSKIDSVSQLFNVLVIKTESLVPYSSVFIQLDCAYWDSNREAKLRKIIKSNTK